MVNYSISADIFLLKPQSVKKLANTKFFKAALFNYGGFLIYNETGRLNYRYDRLTHLKNPHNNLIHTSVVNYVRRLRTSEKTKMEITGS